MRKPASTLSYDTVTIFGKPALFSDYRIDRSTIPPELHMYELRHEDDDWSTPCQIARGIFVNFFGTILSIVKHEGVVEGGTGSMEKNSSGADRK